MVVTFLSEQVRKNAGRWIGDVIVVKVVLSNCLDTNIVNLCSLLID